MHVDKEKAINFDELKDLQIIPSSSKYFVCNECNHWNLVNDVDIHDIVKESRKKEKKVVHMDLEKDFALIVKKFAANFGGYQPMLVFLLDEFYKSRQK